MLIFALSDEYPPFLSSIARYVKSLSRKPSVTLNVSHRILGISKKKTKIYKNMKSACEICAFKRDQKKPLQARNILVY